MGGFQWVAWFMGYVVIAIWMQIVFPKRYDRGYLARFQKKVVNRVMGTQRGFAYWLFDLAMFVAVLWPLSLVLEQLADLALGLDISDYSAWLALFIRLLDDYLNGEDDGWKHRWEATKNKVKWLWSPQQEPVRDWG